MCHTVLWRKNSFFERLKSRIEKRSGEDCVGMEDV